MRSRILLFVATAAVFSNVASAEDIAEARFVEAVRIYSTYKMTESMSVMCRKWHPPASAAVDAAVRKLNEKHAAKIEAAKRVLGEEERKMADENSMDSRKQLDERFHNASAELRRDWCEKFPERIESADRMLTERKL
jgi:hypothetical protein